MPVVLIAVWRSRIQRWGLLLFGVFLVVLDDALLLLPRVDGFQHLQWNWQGKLLETGWPLLLAALVPGISLASLGVTSRLRLAETGTLRTDCGSGATNLAWGLLVLVPIRDPRSR